MIDRVGNQVQAGKAGQAIDTAIDAGTHVATVVVGEQMTGDVGHFAPGHDRRSDRRPEAAQCESRQLLRGAIVLEPLVRLARVEVDVATLLSHDAIE